MTDKNETNHQIPSDRANAAGNASGDGVSHGEIAQPSESRRRLVKGAVVSAPVIMSLASRSAWARSACSYSGQMSGNMSPVDEPCGGEGCTTGFYKNHAGLWHPEFPPMAVYNDVFGVDAFPGMTLADVIGLCETNAKDMNHDSIVVPAGCTPEAGCFNVLVQLGYQSVAALQNAATEVSYDLMVVDVVQMVQMAYGAGTKEAMEAAKDQFDMFNNQVCPFGGGGENCHFEKNAGYGGGGQGGGGYGAGGRHGGP